MLLVEIDVDFAPGDHGLCLDLALYQALTIDMEESWYRIGDGDVWKVKMQ